jgi:hypothetical protein
MTPREELRRIVLSGDPERVESGRSRVRPEDVPALTALRTPQPRTRSEGPQPNHARGKRGERIREVLSASTTAE